MSGYSLGSATEPSWVSTPNNYYRFSYIYNLFSYYCSFSGSNIPENALFSRFYNGFMVFSGILATYYSLLQLQKSLGNNCWGLANK